MQWKNFFVPNKLQVTDVPAGYTTIRHDMYHHQEDKGDGRTRYLEKLEKFIITPFAKNFKWPNTNVCTCNDDDDESTISGH